MATQMTTQDFLNKLSKINWVKTGKSLKTFISDDGFTLNIFTEINGSRYGEALQLVFKLSYKDGYVMSWGAGDKEDNNLMADWYVKAKNEVFEAEYNAGELAGLTGNAIFKSL